MTEAITFYLVEDMVPISAVNNVGLRTVMQCMTVLKAVLLMHYRGLNGGSALVGSSLDIPDSTCQNWEKKDL